MRLLSPWDGSLIFCMKQAWTPGGPLRPGPAKELRILIVQSVEPGGLLHVVGKLVGHSGKEFVLPGLLVLLRQQSGEGAVVQDDVPPQQVVTVLPHDVHLPQRELRVRKGLLLQLDAPIQLVKKCVGETGGDLLQPVPHLLIAWDHGVHILLNIIPPRGCLLRFKQRVRGRRG